MKGRTQKWQDHCRHIKQQQSAPSDENALKELATKFEETVFSQSLTKDRYYSLIAQKIINLQKKTQGTPLNQNPNPNISNPSNNNITTIPTNQNQNLQHLHYHCEVV